MALDDLELSLMTFPQHFAAGHASVNVLLLPVGDPTAPLGTGPQFAGTTVHLVVNVVAGLRALPTPTTPATATHRVLAKPPVVAPALFSELANQFAAKGVTVTGGKLTTASTARIRKALPPSYTNAIPFESPRTTDLEVGEGYCCEIRGQAPPLNSTPTQPDNSIAWGQILSYVLRQPKLAHALGLIYRVRFKLPARAIERGAFIYAALDDSFPANPWLNDWKSNPDTVKSYAARVPTLRKGRRPLFAATLLPVIADPGSDLSTAQFEAAEYDDGFAQIVHCNQPVTIDAATLQTDRIAPATDAGIQIGWDDEQVTVWFNNQLDLLRDRIGNSNTTPEAPLGVQGYRVDVRIKGTHRWSSLCTINGYLPFNLHKLGPPASTLIDGTELWVAPAPIRPSISDDGSGSPANAGNDQNAWLPLYFAQWAGASVVLPDPVVSLLAAAVAAAHTGGGAPHAPPEPNPSPDLADVPLLRYGTDYQVRVRLVDLTGGGPSPADAAVHPGPAPTALARFRRYVPPKALRVQARPGNPPLPANPAPTRAIHTLTVRRPRIGYPEAIFAGVRPSVFRPRHLHRLVKDALDNNGVIAVPDPDVNSFDVVVEARIPAHDTGTPGGDPGELDGSFRVVYMVNVKFPREVESDPAVRLTLDYRDVDDIATMSPPAANTTRLPIPTARNIRVRLYPRCRPRANYYGTDSPPVGPSSDFIVRKAAPTERPLLRRSPETELRALYFQPGSNIPQRLAQGLGLVGQGLTLSAAPGVRAIFGASGALRTTVAGDASAITFASESELLGHWIVALILEVERDWTWDGFVQPLAPTDTQLPSASAPAVMFQRSGTTVGAITVPRAVSPMAASGTDPGPDRTSAQIVFFDAVDGGPAPGAFPKELDLAYSVTAHFEAAPPQRTDLNIRLPITTNPVQTPKIAATGIAESPYVHSADYSETSPRRRYLWVQFEQPPLDPDDSYFGRVLAYGPDPLLAASLQPGSPLMATDSPEPVLSIDPEPVREIFSGQSEDFSGLDAMTELVRSLRTSIGPHRKLFMLPLPPGISSENVELFGFWTYEFRVGHARRWSTAQARFGRPLRVTGIQHPPPGLVCALHRTPTRISVTAPYATAVLNGSTVFDMDLGDPQTQIWFMLYAQVHQADLTSYRNILVAHMVGTPLEATAPRNRPNAASPSAPQPRAIATFAEKEIQQLLDVLGLPDRSPLSVLAVELLPGAVSGASADRFVDEPRMAATAGRRRQAQRTAVTAEAVAEADPLGANLGTRRILRTSALAAVPAVC